MVARVGFEGEAFRVCIAGNNKNAVGIRDAAVMMNEVKW